MVRQRVPGRARKRDANEPEIIEVLEAVGAIVYPVDKPLDLVVIYGGLVWLLEVKNGSLPPSHQRITPEQREFLDLVDGQTNLVHVVNSRESALSAINATVVDLVNATAARLEGSCASLPDYILEIPGAAELLDDQVLLCEGCDWWAPADELDGGVYCGDCLE